MLTPPDTQALVQTRAYASNTDTSGAAAAAYVRTRMPCQTSTDARMRYAYVRNTDTSGAAAAAYVRTRMPCQTSTDARMRYGSAICRPASRPLCPPPPQSVTTPPLYITGARCRQARRRGLEGGGGHALGWGGAEWAPLCIVGTRCRQARRRGWLMPGARWMLCATSRGISVAQVGGLKLLVYEALSY